MPDERRGIAELNGEGEVASGIVLQRVGANALDVINNAKAEIETIAQSLPEGVEIVTVYDRSDLILSAIETLRTTLLEESIVVALVTFVFLLHVRSSLVAILDVYKRQVPDRRAVGRAVKGGRAATIGKPRRAGRGDRPHRDRGPDDGQHPNHGPAQRRGAGENGG